MLFLRARDLGKGNSRNPFALGFKVPKEWRIRGDQIDLHNTPFRFLAPLGPPSLPRTKPGDTKRLETQVRRQNRTERESGRHAPSAVADLAAWINESLNPQATVWTDQPFVMITTGNMFQQPRRAIEHSRCAAAVWSTYFDGGSNDVPGLFVSNQGLERV